MPAASTLLDIVHVIEKLWSASRCFHTATDPDAETWVGTQAARILAGDAPAPSPASAPKPTGWTCPQIKEPRRTGPAATWRTTPPTSTTTRHSRPDGRSPAASFEGAARHLVADRLDITGSRWTVPGAEAVLTLRALISNGDFPQYWTLHTHRERERLYPRPDQHNYELLA